MPLASDLSDEAALALLAWPVAAGADEATLPDPVDQIGRAHV